MDTAQPSTALNTNIQAINFYSAIEHYHNQLILQPINQSFKINCSALCYKALVSAKFIEKLFFKREILKIERIREKGKLKRRGAIYIRWRGRKIMGAGTEKVNHREKETFME